MGLLDLLFPRFCLECGASGRYLCEKCLGKIRIGGVSKDSVSLFKYEGVIRKAILALKYKFASDIAQELAGLSTAELRRRKFFLKKAILVPIPLHRKRQNWRGFNQSEEVGKLIAKEMRWKFLPNLLIRSLNTKPQVGLRGRERRINVENVFSLNPKYRVQKTKDNLLIFDDVYTTGSTLKEAAKVFRKAGVREVWGLTIAR